MKGKNSWNSFQHPSYGKDCLLCINIISWYLHITWVVICRVIKSRAVGTRFYYSTNNALIFRRQDMEKIMPWKCTYACILAYFHSRDNLSQWQHLYGTAWCYRVIVWPNQVTCVRHFHLQSAISGDTYLVSTCCMQRIYCVLQRIFYSIRWRRKYPMQNCQNRSWYINGSKNSLSSRPIFIVLHLCRYISLNSDVGVWS